MKLYRILAAAAIVLSTAVSCNKEISENQFPTAKIRLEPMSLSTFGTKTSVNGNEVWWTASDKIAVFSNIGNYQIPYNLSASSVEGSRALFVGEVGEGTDEFYAIYPYSVANSAAGGLIEITVPVDQTPKEGSFGEEMNISVAKGTKIPGTPQVSGVAFHNVCSYLKFTVPTYVSDVSRVEVTCDRAIAGSTVVNYANLESGSGTVTGPGSANTVSMSGSFSSGSTFWFVLTPGEIQSLTILLTTSDGGNWSKASSRPFTLEAGKPKNLGTIDFVPALTSANAVHAKSGETLTGTDVTVNLGLLSSMMSNVTAVNLQVTNGSGTIVRTYTSGTPAANSVTIPADSSWPYLPQGNYTISGTYTVDGITKDFTQTSFSSQSPTFGVEVSAYTSYDKYSADKDITAANNCTAETIYDVSGKAMISESILGNANYTSLVSALNSSFSYSVDSGTQSGNTFTDCAWGERTLTANCTFDGATMSGTRACQITGLPYNATPPSNSGNHPWSGSANSWESSYVRLHNQTISQTFHIPSNINISVYHKANIRRGTVSTTYTFIISGTTIDSKTPSYSSWLYIDQTYDCEITAQNPIVQCKSTYGNPGTSGTRAEVYSIEINYR